VADAARHPPANQVFTETGIETHQLALFLRYQTTHERAFYKALNTLLKLNRARKQAEREAQLTRARGGPSGQAVSEFVSQAPPQPQRNIGFVSQKPASATPLSPSNTPQLDPTGPFPREVRRQEAA
jgi:hypothetical protein